MIQEDGTTLALAGVEVSIKPSSLPLGTTVSMMVQSFDMGYCHKVEDQNVFLSPLVAIGPHDTLQQLERPVTVRLPLLCSSDHQVCVRVSHTSCYEDYVWESVPDDQVTHDGEHVAFELHRCSILYAQANIEPVTLLLKNNRLFFSVSVSEQRNRLRVTFSDTEEGVSVEDDYVPAHSARATRNNSIREVGISTLQAIIKNDVSSKHQDEGTIQQLSSAIDHNCQVNQPLGERFYVNTSIGSSISHLPGSSADGQDYWWDIEPAPGKSDQKARGVLTVDCLEAAAIEQCGERKLKPSPCTLPFSFRWSAVSSEAGQDAPPQQSDAAHVFAVPASPQNPELPQLKYEQQAKPALTTAVTGKNQQTVIFVRKKIILYQVRKRLVYCAWLVFVRGRDSETLEASDHDVFFDICLMCVRWLRTKS